MIFSWSGCTGVKSHEDGVDLLNYSPLTSATAAACWAGITHQHSTLSWSHSITCTQAQRQRLLLNCNDIQLLLVKSNVPHVKANFVSFVWWSTVASRESQDPPPLDLSFWSFLTFLHHGIDGVERHLLWKYHKKIKGKVGQMRHRSCSLSIQSCTQNRPSPKVQSRSGDWI